MIIVFIDASNVFQTNVILDPKKRIYITLPTMYLEWFRARFPDHPISKCRNSKELIMQSLRNIQGTKDAGYEWFQLLAKIFDELSWKPNSTCKGVWVYIKDNITAYINLVTDDIIYMSRSEGALNKLLNRFSDFFSLKVKTGTEQQFLNYILIQ